MDAKRRWIVARNVAAAAVVAMVPAACGGDDGGGLEPGEEATPWRALPAAPLSGRFAPASVWTSWELIVRGGIFAPVKIESLADGARLVS